MGTVITDEDSVFGLATTWRTFIYCDKCGSFDIDEKEKMVVFEEDKGLSCIVVLLCLIFFPFGWFIIIDALLSGEIFRTEQVEKTVKDYTCNNCGATFKNLKTHPVNFVLTEDDLPEDALCIKTRYDGSSGREWQRKNRGY